MALHYVMSECSAPPMPAIGAALTRSAEQIEPPKAEHYPPATTTMGDIPSSGHIPARRVNFLKPPSN
ncbi:hypothetical protein [Streptacidiphilus sp. EB129]|uniref:hypothetical protein n=1 Tax=Streptacidiphilus sp. EB129 TaxID=3156262 RepID=UPI0035162D10